MLRWLLIFSGVVSAVGCTHLELEHTTLKQNGTWTDLQYQQVLNNLAMFCKNPSVMPYFSVAGTGTTQVSDNGNLAASFSIQQSIPLLSVLSGGVARQVAEQWTVATTTDPSRLEVIKCLYQYTMSPQLSQDCIDIINGFYGYPAPQFEVKWQRFKQLQSGWFQVGCRKEVPRNACYVGHYCDVYVWVMPEGCEGLTQLTLAILDVATADPAPSLMEHYDVQQDQGKYKYRVQRYVCRDDTLPCGDSGAQQDLAEAKSLIHQMIPERQKSKQERNNSAITSKANRALALLRSLEPHVAGEASITSLQKLTMALEAIGNSADALETDATSQALSEEALNGIRLATPAPARAARLNFFQPFQGPGLQFVPR
jgi:hypothetical protein